MQLFKNTIKFSLSTMAAAAFCTAVICNMSAPAWASATTKQIAVGSKATTYEIILGKIVIALLKNNGFTCQDLTGLGDTQLLRGALFSGRVDVCMEYKYRGLKNKNIVRMPDLHVKTGYYIITRRNYAMYAKAHSRRFFPGI